MKIMSNDNLTPRRTSRKKNEKVFTSWPHQAHLFCIGCHGVVTDGKNWIIEVNDYPDRTVGEASPFMKNTRMDCCTRTLAALEPFAGQHEIIDEVIENARYEIDLYNELED